MMTTPERWKAIPTVLCHDWLTGMRGGEKCLEILCDGFPAAPIHTLIAKPEAVSETIRSHPIHTSALQRLPGVTQHYRNMLPLFPAAVRTLRPRDARLQISLNSCIAKSIRKPAEAKHLCYCFTPMRYAWTFYEEYFGSNPVKAAALKPLLASLRAWDRRTADNVDQFVAISQHVQDRIKRFYGRDSVIVYPPVDVSRYTPSPQALAGAHDGFDAMGQRVEEEHRARIEAGDDHTVLEGAVVVDDLTDLDPRSAEVERHRVVEGQHVRGA